MDFSEIIRIPEPKTKVKVELREVVREIAAKKHILIRARLSGWYFPQRAPEPFLVIGRRVSRFVIINDDGTADAYFDVMPPAAKRISFGYGKIVSWDFNVTVTPSRFERLDRNQLPRGIIDLRP